MLIFNKPWYAGEVPEDGKEADVVPAFKKGECNNSSYYKPVSLTLITEKIMERLIEDVDKKKKEVI